MTKDRNSEEWACQGKHGFDTPELAKQVASRRKGSAHPYKCPYCRKWHIGHKSGRKKSRRA